MLAPTARYEVRNEKRVRVRLKLRPGHRSIVAGGQRIRATQVHDDGWIYPEPMYVGDYKRLLSRVQGEKDAAVQARGQEMYDRALRSYIEEVGGKKALADTEQGRLLREQLTAQFADSVEAKVHQLSGHSILPLVAIEVLEENIAPPLPEYMRMLHAVSMQSARPSVADPRVAELESQVAQLKALVESLTEPTPSKRR